MFSKLTAVRRPDPLERKDVSTVQGSSPGAAPKPAVEAPSNAGSSTPPKQTTPAGSTVSARPKETTPAENTVGARPKETTPTESAAGARLVVGPDVKLKGAEILDCDILVVEGCVEATMDSRIIRISDQGAFTGKVNIDIAEIHGCFEGELTARTQLIIHATGRVSGKVRYGKLVIDEGGELCGDIKALSAESRSVPSIGPLPTTSSQIAS